MSWCWSNRVKFMSLSRCCNLERRIPAMLITVVKVSFGVFWLICALHPCRVLFCLERELAKWELVWCARNDRRDGGIGFATIDDKRMIYEDQSRVTRSLCTMLSGAKIISIRWYRWKCNDSFVRTESYLFQLRPTIMDRSLVWNFISRSRDLEMQSKDLCSDVMQK